jgi:hypothetical protein
VAIDAPTETDGAITLTFPNGNTAQAVRAGPRKDGSSLVRALGVAVPRPVLIVAGAADTLDPAVARRLRPLMERGALRAAEGAGAAIVDGGTASGIMQVLGNAASSTGAPVPLIGVAPIGKVTFPGDTRNPSPETSLDSGHSHFVLADSDEWGGETSTLFEVAMALSVGRRAAMLLGGGGTGALDEILNAVRSDMPVIVVSGSGGTADIVARAVSTRKPTPDASTEGAALSEIAVNGNIKVVPLDIDPAMLARRLARDLEEDETLRWAWMQYHAVSVSARKQQRQFHTQQGLVLSLGLLATALVTISAALAAANLLTVPAVVSEPLRIAIVLVPILIAFLVAVSARFRPGQRWILLRGTAESIKREIYRYRARAGAYGRTRSRRDPPEVELAEAVGQALGNLMQTDVNLSSLSPDDDIDAAAKHAAKGDDGMSMLPAARYVQFRIDDQIGFYRRRVAQLERQVFRLRLAMLAMGGVGTFFAAVGVPLVVAVTTSFIGAYSTYLEALQLETTIMLYNQAATDLTAIRGWWTAMPPDRQVDGARIDRLVDHAERIMRSEQTGWVQEMQDAMTQLRLDKSDEAAAEADRVNAEDDSSGVGERS